MSRRNLLGLVLAGAIGTLGGWVFFILALPLPWMLGSMLFTAVAAIGGAPVALALPIRNGFVTHNNRNRINAIIHDRFDLIDSNSSSFGRN